MNDVERQRVHFEAVSDAYFHARQRETHLLLKRLLWDHALRPHGGLLAGPRPRVLEPMCGYGEGRRILEARYGPVFAYTGFDYSAPLVARAQERYPDAEIFHGDVTTFESAPAFDVVILIGGLHHVYARAADVLRRLAGALRPGGHLVNLEPTHDNPLFRRVRERVYRRNALFDDQTERGFALPELNALFRGAGLERVDQLYPGLLAYVLYYNPDAFPALDRGGPGLVRALFRMEAPLYRTALARRLSFATLTVLRRPASAAGLASAG
jgi:SAM-dependent methyltransferase